MSEEEVMSEDEMIRFLNCSARQCVSTLFWNYPEVKEEKEGEIALTVIRAFALNAYLKFNLSQDEVREELYALFSEFVAEYSRSDGNG